MKKILFIALVLLCAVVATRAQNEVQALRYSQYNPFGSARYAAQGGAIGALGGDLTSMITNPAGLAFYRSSEFSVSPSFYWVNTTSDLMGGMQDDSQMKFTLGNAGMVRSMVNDNSKGIVSASFALGYHTLANFNNRTTMRTNSATSSLLDDFTWHANAAPDDLSPFYEQLAFDSYLMPYDEDQGAYWHDMQLDGYGQEMLRTSVQSGYIGEYSLAGAFNFNNLLYVGATAGIHAVRFSEEIYHTETDWDDHVIDFDSFRFREFNTTRGWGYTFRMGMILRPIQLLRFGASFQLPTYYRLTDQKYTDMNSYWDSGSGIDDATASSPDGIYDYRLRTPFRVSANASVILFKLATISAGYEYVDYASSKLDAYDYQFYDENDRIRQDYRDAHNLKAGAELRLGSLYLRGGAQYLMSPFRDPRNDADVWILSAGLGVRTRSAYFDLSYSHSGYDEVYGLYANIPGSNVVSLNRINGNNLMLTVGFKF